ncbi:MAG: acyl-CoA/acyl-ACP dehydrogenase [Acidimicrobiales bacterium]|nr:acyl-CoA/acyl-ACP dehydrogenase [Acidimicrobiales bacterium]
MDFGLTEEQQAVADLATQILTDKVDMERLMAIEASDEWFDRDAYQALADAGLVGIALGEDIGGGGLDIVAFGQALTAQGLTVAPMPLLPTGMAALAIDTYGSDELRQAILPGVCAGSTVLTYAVQEPNDDRLGTPSTAFADGTITGTKSVVEFFTHADHLVVSTDQGLAVVDGPGADPTITATEGSSTRKEPVHLLEFAGTPATLLGGGPDAVGWLVDRATACLCATQLGVTEKALQLTAAYTTEREQFGRPIATFQAVVQRLADQYINIGGIRLNSTNVLWRLAHDLDVDEDLPVAKWWASERATDVAHATQHCHGGMGVSVDYPLYRYTLWNKHIATSLGGGTQQLRRLGQALATG